MLKIKIGQCVYVVQNNTMIIQQFNKKGIFKKEIMNCDIKDIEILYYHASAKRRSTTFILISPEMLNSHQCIAKNEEAENLTTLYTYLREQGVVDRNLSNFAANFSRHSSVEEKEKERKAAVRAARKDKKVQEAILSAQKRKQASLRSKCHERREEQYFCTRCRHIWYVSDAENLRNVANILHGSIYSINQVKEAGKCPQCGSIASRHKTVKIWFDKNGNVVDVEE